MEEEEENLDHCSRFHLWLTFLSIIDISSEYFRNILKKVKKDHRDMLTLVPSLLDIS